MFKCVFSHVLHFSRFYQMHFQNVFHIVSKRIFKMHFSHFVKNVKNANKMRFENGLGKK